MIYFIYFLLITTGFYGRVNEDLPLGIEEHNPGEQSIEVIPTLWGKIKAN